MRQLPQKILIANRGEVVVRIARSCRAMGIASVGVFSDADAGSLHVTACDEAVRLPGTAPADTYLRAELLLAAAKRTDADSVHPGFGFLAEDDAFAQAVIDAGLTWIGPSPEVIAKMGDKLAAKRAMAAVGVPQLPSVSLEEVPDRDDLLELAEEIGLPVMVKAAAGGGGKGMRVVHDPVDLAGAVLAARREAEGAFGDPRLFLEKYVARTRHLEVQVLGDSHGNVVHLFERECSIQRRHQKVVEETPSPAIDDEVRTGLCNAAVAAASAIGYVSAGTVEFVANERLLARRRAGEPIDPQTAFAFLEVNARLQVEHPITEEVVRIRPALQRGRPGTQPGEGIHAPDASGDRLDLVRLQILVAAGYAVPFVQEDLVQRGHAIEARLYAEDPAAGYLPATGHLDVFEPDPEVRWDLGLAAGEQVSPHYDPMLAKAIAHAPTRAEAAARLATALARTPVAGVTTNLDLLIAVMGDEAFLAGDTTTSYLDDRGELLLAAADQALVDRAAICVALHDALERKDRSALLPSLPVGFAPSGTFDPQVTLRHDDPVTVRYRQGRDGRWRVRVGRDLDPDMWTPLNRDEQAQDVEVAVHGPDHLDVEVAGLRTSTRVVAAGDARLVGIEGRWVRFSVVPRLPANEQALAAGSSTAPMPGKVTSVEVAAGDVVDVGTPLLTVEAMKMEHRLTATVAGEVTEVRVAVGTQVDAGEVLVVVADHEDASAEPSTL